MSVGTSADTKRGCDCAFDENEVTQVDAYEGNAGRIARMQRAPIRLHFRARRATSAPQMTTGERRRGRVCLVGAIGGDQCLHVALNIFVPSNPVSECVREEERGGSEEEHFFQACFAVFETMDGG